MADYWPAANGVWSNLSNWLTATGVTAGNLPTINDNVYADGKTVTIDIDATASTIFTTQRTGGTVGGGFTIGNGVSLSANCQPGTTACLTFSLAAPNAATLVGNVTGSATTTNAYGVNNSNTGTFTIYGDIRASIGQGAINTSSGTFNLFGNTTGGGGGAANNIYGINAIGGTVNIVGNAYGGIPATTSSNTGVASNGNSVTINLTGNVFSSATNTNNAGLQVQNFGNQNVNILGNVYGLVSNGLNNSSTTSNVNITGTVVGGTAGGIFGVSNTSTGSVTVVGTVSGGIATNANGINNSSTGFVYATRVVGNDFGLGSVGIGVAFGLLNSQNGKAYVEQVEFGSRGATPISGPVYILPSNRNTLTGRLTALGDTVTFYNSLSIDNLIPPASSVRLGEVYNVGNSVGTMAVPSASAVQFGVPVDNTVGTAALQPQDVWGYARLSATEVDSMGDRLRNTATTQSIGYQIASFNL